MVDINVYDGIIVKEKLVSLPPLLFPVGTDPLNVPDHSLAHRVFAQTGNSPEGSVSVDANGNVVILGSIKNPLFQDLQSEFAFAQLIRFQELLYDINGNLITITFNSNATAMGAATPNLTIGYTNATGTASRATPAVLPVGKTAASNSIIIYSGATAAGKYNLASPLQQGDTGLAQIDSIRHSTAYTTGEYSVAMYKELARFPISTLGLAAERNFLYEMPSLPRIYDGAALYWLIVSSTTTPANTGFSGHLDVVWN